MKGYLLVSIPLKLLNKHNTIGQVPHIGYITYKKVVMLQRSTLSNRMAPSCLLSPPPALQPRPKISNLKPFDILTVKQTLIIVKL